MATTDSSNESETPSAVSNDTMCCTCGGLFKFSHTYEDWFDGDDDDIYVCENCGKTQVVYIPR
jgi:hypothetical protein